MSEGNVETVRRSFDAFNRGDLDVVPDLLDADAECHLVLLTMLGGEAAVVHGHEEYRDFYRDLQATFAEFHAEIGEIHDMGERTVSIGRLSGRGKESGAEFEMPIGWVHELKGGKITRIDDYTEPQEAFAAARQRE